MSANTDNSSPSRNSSITTSCPASPKIQSPSMDLTALSASCSVVQTTAPFPAASPDAFTTIGAPCLSIHASAAGRSVNVLCSAVGMPAFHISSLEYALLDSIRAALACGPKIGKPTFSKWSTMPSAKGASGPTIVKSILLDMAQPDRLPTSVASICTLSQSEAIPPLG